MPKKKTPRQKHPHPLNEPEADTAPSGATPEPIVAAAVNQVNEFAAAYRGFDAQLLVNLHGVTITTDPTHEYASVFDGDRRLETFRDPKGLAFSQAIAWAKKRKLAPQSED